MYFPAKSMKNKAKAGSNQEQTWVFKSEISGTKFWKKSTITTMQIA
jgi:hypothetical protein